MPSSIAPASPEPFITVDALAQILGVPKSFIYERTSRGQIPCYRIGRLLRFRLSEVEAWLDEERQSRGGPNGR